MQNHEPAIRRFFEAYQGRMNAALQKRPAVDVTAAAAAFARYFVGSSPRGVAGARNGWLFRFMIPRGYAHYRRLGTQRMEIRGLSIVPLDDYHALARTHWWSSYRRKSGEPVEIEFDNIYVLRIAPGQEPQIFAYITGDEQQVLKDHGLV
jgi:hypothetical protein